MNYAIVKTPNFYAGSLPVHQPHYLKNWMISENQDQNAPYAEDIAFFETKAEAEAIIANLEDGIYYTSHGEAGRPGYNIVEWPDNDNADCLAASGYMSDEWQEIDEGDIPEDILHCLDNTSVEYHRSQDTCDVYMATAEDENDLDEYGEPVEYAIVFCPTALAIERNSDDLGNINWANQVYYVKR